MRSMSYKISLKRLTRPGFTLIETVAVLFVVSVGLIGVLSLIVQNIQSQNLSKHNIISYQLAQEGVEFVRKVRDTNWKNGLTWNTGLLAGRYYMDYRDNLPHLVLSESDAKLGLSGEGYYVHSDGIYETPFSRVIEIESIDDNSLRIYSRVIWADRNNSFSYDLEAVLYNWY